MKNEDGPIGMIAGAMDWIKSNTLDYRRKPIEINGRLYDLDGKQFLPEGYRGVAGRLFSTLSGFCDYLGAEGLEVIADDDGRPCIRISEDKVARLYIHVEDWKTAKAVSATLPKTSDALLVAGAKPLTNAGPGANGASFECGAEEAGDILMANYHPDAELVGLIDALSDIRMADETRVETKGIVTRITTSRKTKSNPEAAEITNPVTLTPILGFPEIDPLPKKYNIRLTQRGDGGVRFYLGEIADPKWDAEMAGKVEKYLKDRLQAGNTGNMTQWHVFR